MLRLNDECDTTGENIAVEYPCTLIPKLQAARLPSPLDTFACGASIGYLIHTPHLTDH